MIDVRSFQIGVVVGAGAVVVVQLVLLVIRPWRRAFFSGASVPLGSVIGMRLRGNPPTLLIDAFIHLRKLGIDTSIDEVEVVYITNRLRASTPETLVRLVQEKKARQ